MEVSEKVSPFLFRFHYFHLVDVNYVSVIVPLAVEGTFTYTVPEHLKPEIAFGKRVEVALRNKLYSAIIVELHEQYDAQFRLKPIISILDQEAIILPFQYKFWKWMAAYYLCTLGEVMTAALPSALRLSSETKISLATDELNTEIDYTDDEYLVVEALSFNKFLSIQQIRDILGKKTVYPIIRDLIDRAVIEVEEELIYKYKAKYETFVKLNADFQTPEGLDNALELTKRSQHQTNAVKAFYDLSPDYKDVAGVAIREMAGVTGSVLKSLEKKGIVELYEKEISRLEVRDAAGTLDPFSEEQRRVYNEIRTFFDEDKSVVLLHGVTGSGKTRIYMELIQETIDKGGQVLYLLPEIALTTQLVDRLTYIFGKDVGIFHSRMNNQERVELWNEVLVGKKIIIGARSAIMLPFVNLQLIVVDEEHDPSYKQHDPSPRYNARDCSILLSRMLDVNVVLGSATPSLESYAHAEYGHYGYVELTRRFGDILMPEIEIIDLKRQYKTGRMKSMFSLPLRNAIEEALEQKEQIILFQNRRGFSPIISCGACGWTMECQHCDVTLTYHKYFDECRCHYCGYREKKPPACPSCGDEHIVNKGYGTEQVAEAIQTLFPEATIDRLDYDNTRRKDAFQEILFDFDHGNIDILVGTQMVTKGLDFDNISLVAVVNADGLFRFPDFRADERAYQLLTQVAGRAGRKRKRGKVIIQTFTPDYPILDDVVNYRFHPSARRLLSERRDWVYPPFYKMIQIQISHRKPAVVRDAAQYLADALSMKFGKRIIGPSEPGIARIRGRYIRNIVIKMTNQSSSINDIKNYLKFYSEKVNDQAGWSAVRVKVDVDPY